MWKTYLVVKFLKYFPGDLMGLLDGIFGKKEMSKKTDDNINDLKLEMGMAFISCINEIIQTVAAGSHGTQHFDLQKDVNIQTRGFQLSTDDLIVIKEAATIAIAAAATTVANNHGIRQDQLVSTLWSGSNIIVVTLSRDLQNKFVWELDLDE